jgi:hypothetical protein
MDQGFTVGGLKRVPVKRAPKPHTPSAGGEAASTAPSSASRLGGMAGAYGLNQTRERSALDPYISGAGWISGIANMAWLVDGASFLMTPVKWVAGKAGAEKLSNRLGGWQEKATAARAINFAEAGAKLEAKGGMLGSLGKLLAKGGTRFSVFTGIIGVGAAAAIGGHVLGGFKQSAAAKAAMKEMEADFGHDHPLVVAARNINGKQSKMQVLSTGFASVGELANVGFAHGFGDGSKWGVAAMMGGQMILPQLGQLLVSDNRILNAYKTLKLADGGGVSLEPPQRAQLYRELVGAMPQVTVKGGVYNRLAQKMSDAMGTRAMSLKDVAGLTGNNAQFMAFATEVSAATKAAPEVVKPPLAANANAAVTPYAPDTKPSPKIAALSAANEGTVTAQQKALGQA